MPWYNLHKLLAGLIDACRYCDSARALEVATRFGDWVDDTTRNLTEAQWQRMLACEFGGMNESLADLYALTGEKKYLDLANKFYHKAILDPLAAGRDELPGKHANTQIPKLIGAARIYELTGDAKNGSAARNFYSIVLTNHTYVTGGNSQGEHFGPARKLDNRLGASTTETCNTYNMLKLNRHLFGFEPSAALAEFQSRWPSWAATSSSVSEWLAARPRASMAARRRRAMALASSVVITAAPFRPAVTGRVPALPPRRLKGCACRKGPCFHHAFRRGRPAAGAVRRGYAAAGRQVKQWRARQDSNLQLQA